MLMDNEQKKTRRGVLLLIALSTLAFFALGLFFAVMRERVASDLNELQPRRTQSSWRSSTRATL